MATTADIKIGMCIELDGKTAKKVEPDFEIEL